MSTREYSKPPAGNKERCPEVAAMSELLDLRGIRCPLSWAKAKVRLEELPHEGALELILDDPKGARDIPRAAEAEGYAVAAVDRRPTEWRILIYK